MCELLRQLLIILKDILIHLPWCGKRSRQLRAKSVSNQWTLNWIIAVRPAIDCAISGHGQRLEIIANSFDDHVYKQSRET